MSDWARVIVRCSMLFAVCALAHAVAAQDVVTVGTVSAAGPTIDVPIYIRDVSATRLGVDQPAGRKIQGFSVKVVYSPATAVSNVTASQSGITASLSPFFSNTPRTSSSITYIGQFNETSDPIPFTSNKPAPGDEVAKITLTLSGSATPGTVITLTLDPTTELTNAAGTESECPDSIACPGDRTLSLASGSVTVLQAQADLSLSKSATPSASVGAPISYTLSVTNGGPNAASSVQVTDTLPAGVTFTSASGTGWSCSQVSGTVTCTMSSLAVGAAAPITIAANAPSTAGTVTNSASVSSATTDPSAANNTSSASTTITASADLAIAKSDSPDPVDAGGNLTYTLSVTNNGPSVVSSATVTDTLPSGVTLLSASGSGWSCSGTATVTCTAASLPVGAAQPISIVVRAPANGGSLTNSASVTASTSDPTPSNNSASASTTATPKADLSMAMTDNPDPVLAGATITYAITIANAGPSSASSISVVDTLPGGATLTGSSGTGWSCGAAAATVTCTLGSLAAGSNSTLTLQVRAPSTAGTATNAATVSSAISDPAGTNNSASVTTTVNAPASADFSVTKSAPASALLGAELTYQITVRNNGPDASASTLSDALPSGATFVSIAPSDGCSGTTTISCAVASLASGASKSFSLVVRGAQVGTLTNTAQVTGAVNDPVASNNASTATTNVSAPACPVAFSGLAPSEGAANVPLAGTLIWTPTGADSYQVFLGVAGTGCTTLLGTTTSNSIQYTGLAYETSYEWRVVARKAQCADVASSCTRFTTACNKPAASLLAPANNATDVVSPVTFRWGAVAGAISYELFASIDGSPASSLGTTSDTSMVKALTASTVEWFVRANFSTCSPVDSSPFRFTLKRSCPPIAQPVVTVIGEVVSSQKYRVSWPATTGATNHEVDESLTRDFKTVTTKVVAASSLEFTHEVTTPTEYFYRVRGISSCDASFGAYSVPVRTVVTPRKEAPTEVGASVPAGSDVKVVHTVTVPAASPGTSIPFVASVDQPWLTVTPASGVLTASAPATLTVTSDPKTLAVGTNTGTVVVTNSTTQAPIATTPVALAVSSGVTPVLNKPASGASLLFPSLFTGERENVAVRSDLRISNTSTATATYVVALRLMGDEEQLPPSKGKRRGARRRTGNEKGDVGSAALDADLLYEMTVNIPPGQTMAIDDVLRRYFGVGSLGESAVGSLEIRPSSSSSSAKRGLAEVPPAASGRTYGSGAAGSVGQFAPVVAVANAVTKPEQGPSPVLNLHQIIQSTSLASSIGLIELAQKNATALLRLFDSRGTLLRQIAIPLLAGERKTIALDPSLLVQNGRAEISVADGAGAVAAYATVRDASSRIPSSVPPFSDATSAGPFVIVGASGGAARTDLTLHNASGSAVTAGAKFTDGTTTKTASIALAPSETRTLTDVVTTLFSASGDGVIRIDADKPGVNVSGRRYANDSAFGDYLAPFTADSAGASAGTTVHLLQAEESERLTTDLGLLETAGAAATVEIKAIVPGSTVVPQTSVTLQPNEYKSLKGIFKQIGLGRTYVARVSVRVTSGSGKVVVWGVLTDPKSGDQTFVPALR